MVTFASKSFIIIFGASSPVPAISLLPYDQVHFNRIFHDMLGFSTLALLSPKFFAFLSTEMYIVAGVAIAAAVGVFVALRFRTGRGGSDGKLELSQNEASVSQEASNSASRSRDVLGKPAASAPTRADLAHLALNDRSNFSKNYAESLEINHLPIGRIDSIVPPPPVEELDDSDDEGLLAAIDEVQDDADADSEFRSVALRVLAGFKNRNAIDELSQIALYDLSSNLRAKAVMMLADFDHESVFEPIVLACADPSREVRAAGARALVKITFDRADAWTRIARADDRYMSRQVARAAVEAGIAERSFDRLVLNDEKAVDEAFALTYLLIKAGETEKLFEAIKDHRDLKTRVALLHAIKVANVAEVIPDLTAFIAAEPMGSVVADKAREALLGINAMPVTA